MTPSHLAAQRRLDGPATVTALDPAAWDACVTAAGGFGLFSSTVLAAYERGEPDKEPCHLLVRGHGGAAALAPLFAESWRSPHARDMARRVPQPGALTATGTVRWGIGFAVTCGGPVLATGPEGEDGMARIAAVLEGWAAGGAVVGFTNVPAGNAGLGVLERRGWLVVEQDVEHVLEAGHGGAAGHVAALEGSRARNLRRSLRRLEEEQVTFRPAATTDLALLARLLAEDEQAHGLLRPLVPFTVVEHLVAERSVGDVRLAVRDGQVIGYGVGVRGRGGTWLLTAGARAPMVDQVHGLYLDYLGSLPPGARLYCGRENFVFKDRLGCARKPMYAAFTAPPVLLGTVRGWLDATLPAVLGRARAAFEGSGFPLPADLDRGDPS